jgi:hypothetical protein
MKLFKLIAATGLVAVFLTAGMAFGAGPGSQGPPRWGCMKRFSQLDTNHDGKLTKKEFMAAHHWRHNPEKVFNAMDVHGRGYVTVQEFCAGKGAGRGMGQAPGAATNQ